jgi:hypothetical protein
MRRATARAWSLGTLGACILLFTLWWTFVRAPGPETVCRHIVTVTMQEAGQSELSPMSQDALVRSLEDRCIQHKLDIVQLRGRVVYSKYAKCVLASSQLADIERC